MAGCSAPITGETVKKSLNAPVTNISQFSHCSSYGCQKVQQTAFKSEEWETIKLLFSPAPQSSSEEREIVSLAVAEMEKIIGPKTGTDKDDAKSWLFTLLPKGQLDCIDESINTTTYLQLLKNDGLIQYHDIGKIALRGDGFGFDLLHNTATLIEKESGTTYAIDSWFQANGEKADIVLLDEWLNGWSP